MAVGAAAQALVGADCTFTITVTLPDDILPGELTFDAEDTEGNTADTTLAVVWPALTIVNPLQYAGIDTENTAIGTDWEPGVPVNLTLYSVPPGPRHPDPGSGRTLQHPVPDR